MTRLLLLALLAACLLPAAARAAGIIGLSLPATGRFAPMGREIEMGVLKAIEDHVARGGKRPQLAPVDDRCEAAGAHEGLETLTQRQADVLIGVPCFEPALVYGDELDIPIVAVGLRHAAVPQRIERGRLNVLGPPPDAEALAAADLVLPRWRDKPFAIVDDGGVYGRALAERLRELAEERGLRPQQLATYRPLQSTQAALVRRLENAGIEAVFVAGEAEDAAAIARDAARLGKLEVATGETGALLPHVETAAGSPSLLVVARRPSRTLPPAAILIERMDARGDFASDPFLEGYALGQVALGLLSQGGDIRARPFDTVLGRLDFASGRATGQPFILQRWDGQALTPVAQ